MKRILTLLLLLLTVLPSDAARATSIERAKKSRSSRPIVLFCYPANFNKASEKLHKSFFRGRKVTRTLARTTYVEIPIYQTPDKKEKRIYDKIVGKGGIPGGIKGLPCFIILDSAGNHLETIQGSILFDDIKATNIEIQKVLDIYEKQKLIVKKANRTKSKMKAILVAEAIDMGLPVSGGLIAAAAAVDRENNKVVKNSRFTYVSESEVPKLDKRSPEQAYNRIRKIIIVSNYSKFQRQELLVTLSGHLHRQGVSDVILRSLYFDIRNIDPTSVYGSYADEAIRLWCPFQDLRSEEDQAMDKK